MVNWKILTCPWARHGTQSTELVVGVRPLLMVAPSVTEVQARDLNIDLPRIGSRQVAGQEWSLFEMITPGSKAGGSEELEFQIGGYRQRFQLEGGLSFDRMEKQDVDPADPGQRLQGFLGRHVELAYGPIEAQSRLIGGCAAVDLTEFLEGWGQLESTRDPRLALIVKLAKAIYPVVNDVGSNPRRVLRRERKMERVGAVRQIDPAGIRWLVRQPGDNLAERAGPRQKVLAVVREQSVDTPENRVVRDLIERSIVECRSWIRDHSDAHYRETKRYQDISRFAATIGRLRVNGPLAGLRRSTDLAEPNYVLQHDVRYSRIWPWYVKLRRRQQEEDRLWRWSHRAFAESIRLALSWSLDELEVSAQLPKGVGFRRTLLMREEQHYGNFVDPRSELCGWLVGGQNNLSGISLLSGAQVARFEKRAGLRTQFASLALDALVVAHDPFSLDAPSRALVIWARLRMGGTTIAGQELEAMAESVANVCGRIEAEVLLVEPGQFGDAAELIEYGRVPTSSGESVRVRMVQTPLEISKSVDVLRGVLNSSLSKRGPA